MTTEVFALIGYAATLSAACYLIFLVAQAITNAAHSTTTTKDKP